MQKKCRFSKEGEVNCINCGTCSPKTEPKKEEKKAEQYEQLKLEFEWS